MFVRVSLIFPSMAYAQGWLSSPDRHFDGPLEHAELDALSSANETASFSLTSKVASEMMSLASAAFAPGTCVYPKSSTCVCGEEGEW